MDAGPDRSNLKYNPDSLLTDERPDHAFDSRSRIKLLISKDLYVEDSPNCSLPADMKMTLKSAD
jgi:hypothetical protein